VNVPCGRRETSWLVRQAYSRTGPACGILCAAFLRAQASAETGARRKDDAGGRCGDNRPRRWNILLYTFLYAPSLRATSPALLLGCISSETHHRKAWRRRPSAAGVFLTTSRAVLPGRQQTSVVYRATVTWTVMACGWRYVLRISVRAERQARAATRAARASEGRLRVPASPAAAQHPPRAAWRYERA